MTPLAFSKELDRSQEELDLFRELADAEIDLVAGGVTEFTCVYNPAAPSNDTFYLHC